MIGNILILLAMLSGVFTILMYYYTFKEYSNTLTYARIGFYIMTGLVTAASVFLLYIILTHQYQYSYVFDYSGGELSFGLLLSTFFAGQEGSFLLWLLFTVILGLFMIKYLSGNIKQEASFMMFFTLVALFLAILVSPLLKNPFAYMWSESGYFPAKYFGQQYLSIPDIQKFIFANNTGEQYIKFTPHLKSVLAGLNIPLSSFIVSGKGLNPLLQNFWMQIHPPLLFVGFAMSAIPYSFAMSALVMKEYKTWISKSLPWVVASMTVLGLALMIGGYWAYGVLGWGGFWGWDPVENSSLVPWIIGIALIHTLVIQRNTQTSNNKGKYVRTNLVLSILTFVFVIYSTFLTRSGILSEASVHSFSAPGQVTYLFLVAFILTFTIVGVGGVILRWKDLKNEPGSNIKEAFFSRENGLIYGSALLLGSALIIIVGTSAPIFGRSVETSFYDTMNLPLVILMTFLISTTLMLRWRTTETEVMFKEMATHLLISGAITAVIAYLVGISSIVNMLFALSISFTVVTNTTYLLRNLKVSKLITGGQITHIGFAVFLLGVLISGNFSTSQEIQLPRGRVVKALNHEFKFTGYTPFDNGKKYAFNVLINDNNSSWKAAPVMFSSEYNNSIMREPDILMGLSKDFYISPVEYSEGNNSDQKETLTIEASIKPNINLVWLGIIIITFGMTVSTIRRKREEKMLKNT
jgi:cytochrome c-type biogenesis protein CcmF